MSWKPINLKCTKCNAKFTLDVDYVRHEIGAGHNIYCPQGHPGKPDLPDLGTQTKITRAAVGTVISDNVIAIGEVVKDNLKGKSHVDRSKRTNRKCEHCKHYKFAGRDQSGHCKYHNVLIWYWRSCSAFGWR